MNNIIDNNGTYDGGYFIKNPDALTLEYQGGDGFVVSSQKERGLLAELILQAEQATHYIKLCSFIIDNKQVFDVLINHLKKGKISIFVLTAVNEQGIQSDLLNEEDDNEDSKRRHLSYISQLVQYGAHVRASTNAHAKFLVRDGKEALLMSANLTEPSLNGNEKGNPPNDESGIVILKNSDVLILEKVFDAIFLYGTEFKKFITLNDKSQLIHQQEPDILIQDLPELNAGILLSYEAYHQTIYSQIINLLAGAQQSVYLATYSIVMLERLPELTTAIEQFTQRGGKISIFCRAMNHKSEQIKACTTLSEYGVTIYGDMFNHAKGMLADERHGLIFTANIDGVHGLINGFEVGYKFEPSDLAFPKFKEFMLYQAGNAPYLFKTRPQKKELYQFYADWYQKKFITPAKIPLRVEVKYRANNIAGKKFENYIRIHPVFYSKIPSPNTPSIQFEIFDCCFLLEQLSEDVYSLIKEVKFWEQHKGEKYLFCYESITITAYEQ